MDKDPRALNAVGYIYFHAPEVFEKDSTKLRLFGTIRKDLKEAFKKFKAASHYGSSNAKFNLGSMYLTGDKFTIKHKTEQDEVIEFSFS